jgi:transposase
MRSISSTQLDIILSLLDQGLSSKAIASRTHLGHSNISKICSKHCPNLQKSNGGHPSELSSTTICHSMCLISIGKLDTATQVARELSHSHQVSVSSKTVCRTLRKQGMKANTKVKKAKLKPHHAKARLE